MIFEKTEDRIATHKRVRAARQRSKDVVAFARRLRAEAVEIRRVSQQLRDTRNAAIAAEHSINAQ